MRTTVPFDDDLLSRAQELSGLSERSPLLRQALVALVERESARRLGTSEPQLTAALEGLEVATHPWVIGELACGHLRQRQQVLPLLAMLPSIPAGSPRSDHAAEARQ